MTDFYHAGMRDLQDRFEGREVPDRLAEHRMRAKFNNEDRACITTSHFFFLSTATDENVDCSYKGGAQGFVRITGENTLAWPDYDGNRMYRSLGNIVKNPRVGILFVRFDGKLFNNASRLRINGIAEIDESPAAIAGINGAKLLIRVTAEHIFTNCPRYIPTMSEGTESIYVPRDGKTAPAPHWKEMDFVKDIFEAEKDSS